MNEIILLGLSRDDLEQGPVLVEEQIRISIAQDPCAFGCQHEQLFPSIWNEEGPYPVLPPAQWMALRRDLVFAGLVSFAWHIFVAFGTQLVGGVIPYGGQRFDDGRLGRRGFGRG